MFTGLVTAVGTIRSARAADGGLALVVRCPWRNLAIGESVAVDGACLTVARRLPGAFAVHVVATSLERTAFGDYRPGRRVNLERALRAGDRLGGHLVQGHVDGLGRIRRIRQKADARLLDIVVPAEVAQATVPLGSLTVDGVSLTVNALLSPRVVQVSLIPYTLLHTTLEDRVVGDRVHLEGDTIGKYVAAWLGRRGGNT
jgi:riboflavin synthase